MAGVRYLDALALKLELPLVICVSIGSNMGNHSGTGPLSEMLGTLGTQKGHCVVCAAGNEAGQRHHYAGSIQKDEVQIVELRVDEKTKGFTMELWSEAPQVLGISILSPSGEVVPKLPLPITGKQVHKFIFEDTTVTVDYQMVGSKSADQLIFFNFDQPVVGIWKIYVYPETLSTGEYNLWLPTHNFVDGNVIFVESNPDITVTNPANSQLVITAGAYDTSNRSLYLDSGRGYNILDNVKPDLTAPGVRVYGPGIADSYTTRTGTSAAAAVMAGASTLYMQWSYYQKKNLNVNTAEIRNALQRGADKPGVRVYPNNEWGYGILNLYSTFEKMRISTT